MCIPVTPVVWSGPGITKVVVGSGAIEKAGEELSKTMRVVVADMIVAGDVVGVVLMVEGVGLLVGITA